MKRTVVEMLRTAANNYSNTPYPNEKSDSGWINKTFSEVNQDSDYIGAYLIDSGIQKEDKIAILSEGRIAWVTGEYGILKAGAISVPLSIKLLPEEVLFRLNHSGSKGILLTHNTFEKIAPIWEKIEEKDFKIYYLDSDIEKIKSDAFEFGIDIDKDAITFEKMLEKGKSVYDKNAEPLKKSLENIQENDVVTISYTSGTTGNPKGIMLTQLNYYANSNDAMDFFKLPEGFKTLLILPLDHSFAHTVGIYISLLKGIGIYFVDARGGSVNTLKNIPINLKEVSPDFLLTVPALTGNFMKKITDAIKEKGGFVSWLFNAGLNAGIAINQDGYKKAGFFTQMLKFIPYKLANALIFKKVRSIFGENLQFCVGGGALLDIKQQKFFYALGVPVYQGYGLTEATPIISANAVHTHKLGTSGPVLPGITCKIVDPDRNELPKGVKGEIAIKGNNIMAGYYKNEKASNEVLNGEWLYTGDMGYIEEDNFLMVVGREKALLISEDGEKYSPEEIEEAIVNSSELINQVMIYNDHKKYTTALITLDIPKVKKFIKDNHIADEEVLMKEINKSFYQFKYEKEYANKFPEKWIPAVFTIIAEPFTEENKMINSTLKMVRYKITETYQNDIAEMYENGRSTSISPKNEETIKNLLPFH
ncbi:MAG: AMP-binding protein [Bacteroidales bacterium]|nr:AMP-binding protein [Bacteroidales bacterium]